MFCQNCGNELREGAAFCQNCGQPIRETANVRSERPNAPAYIPPQQTQTGYFTPGQGQSGAVYPEAASTQKPKKKGRGCLIAAVIVLAVIIAVPFLGGLGLTWFLNRYDAQKDASPIRAVEVTFPASTGAQAVVEQQAAVAVEAYLVARAYTDKLENYDLDSFDPDEYAALLDRTVAAWEAADALAAGLEGNAELLVALEDEGITGSAGTVGYRALASGRALQNPLFTTAYAADGEEKTAKEWAEEIQQMYDAYPPGKAIQGLAHAMKTDTAHAAVIHQQAQAILKGEADAEAGYYNAAYKTAVETKAAATVAGAAVAVVATGGTAGAVAHAFAVGGTVCSGAQAILDVGTAYTIHATDGEGDEYTAAFERTSNQFAPVAGIFGLLNAGVNAYNMYQGVDVYDNAVQAGIWAANELLSHIQGDGTMLGGTFKQNSDGTVSFTMIETMLGGDISHEDAVALALQSMGIDTATIEEARAIAAGEAAAPTEPDGLGEAADAFIEQWDIFTDPDEPFDAAGFNDYMSERFEGAAEEQRLAAGDRPVAAAVPQLNPATDWFEEDDPDEPANSCPHAGNDAGARVQAGDPRTRRRIRGGRQRNVLDDP